MIDLSYGFYLTSMDQTFFVIALRFHKYCILVERLDIVSKNVDIGKLSDFDKISILSTIIFTKDNLGIVEIVGVGYRLYFDLQRIWILNGPFVNL